MDLVKPRARHLKRRRPSLTPPPESLGPATRSLKKRLQDQAKCGLLSKLPTEIRLMIWESVIGGLHLHINARFDERGLAHLISKHDGGECDLCYMLFYGISKRGLPFRPPTYRGERSLLSLLTTCRQIYSEAVDILYKSNTFVFTKPGLMQRLQISILPNRWNIIRSLEVHWQWGEGRTLGCGHARWALLRKREKWKSDSQMIKTLKSLQHLTLIPRYFFCDYDAASMQRYVLESLEPLKDLCLKGRWELKISGSEDVIKAVDAALKRSGFGCFVTRLKE